MTFTRLHIAVFLGAAVLVWGGVLAAQGVCFTWDDLGQHLAPFSTVVTVLVSLAFALDRWLWHAPTLHGWFVKRPDLRGTWKVTLQSDWKDPSTEEGIPPITCFMGVKQTLSTLKMHLMTPESESWFVADAIRPSPNGEGYEVIGVYTNKPDVLLRGVRSEIHLGSLVLHTHGPENRPGSLTGEYWTERKTTGKMVLEDCVAPLFTRYTDAAKAFGIAPRTSSID